MFGRKLEIQNKPASSGGGQPEHWIKRFAKGQTEMRVRPLTEPSTEQDTPGAWVTYTEVWDNSVGRSWPIDEGEVVEEHYGPRKKHLACMLDLENDRVIALQVPVSVATAFHEYEEKFGTVLNQDYVITRSGSGKEGTSYSLLAGPATERDMSAYQLLDLEQVLRDARQHAVDEGWAPPMPGEQGQSPEPEPQVAPESNGSNGQVTDDTPLGELRSMARAAGVNPSGLSRQELVDAVAGLEPF